MEKKLIILNDSLELLNLTGKNSFGFHAPLLTELLNCNFGHSTKIAGKHEEIIIHI